MNMQNLGQTAHPQVVLNGVSFNAEPGQRPVLVDGCDTIVKLFQLRCQARLGYYLPAC